MLQALKLEQESQALKLEQGAQALKVEEGAQALKVEEEEAQAQALKREQEGQSELEQVRRRWRRHWSRRGGETEMTMGMVGPATEPMH